MTDWKGFKGRAKKLDDIDLPRIGARIGVGEDELHAFMEVEAAGSGFDSKGRPKMLFEPHVFYRNLTGAKRKQAVSAGLAYAKWKSGSYPKDSYPRLEKAMAIDETAALKAASWGLGQVLGENHRSIGFTTPQAMVLAFMDDEEKHVEGMVDFLIANKIDDDLRAHNWAQVARVYNGAGYAKHNYHGRMKAAFAKWQKIRDTAWKPDEDEKAEAAPPRLSQRKAPPSPLGPLPEALASKPTTTVTDVELVAQPGSKPDLVKAASETKTETPMAPAPMPSLAVDEETAKRVQELLREKGYYEVATADGDAAGRSQGAILAFKNEHGLPLTPDITTELIVALEQAPHRYVTPDRASAKKGDLMKSDSAVAEPLRNTWWTKLIAAIVAIPSLLWSFITGAFDYLGDAMEKLGPVKEFLVDVPVWTWGIIGFSVAGVLWIASRNVDAKLVDMSRRGEVT